MDLNKTNCCKICGWIGRTHLHHIIPLSKQGLDIPENIVELCPNHHSEATGNEEDFAEKFGLLGKRRSVEERKRLQEYSLLLAKYASGEYLSTKEIATLAVLMDAFKFTLGEAIGCLLGLSKNSVERSFGKSLFKDKQKQEGSSVEDS